MRMTQQILLLENYAPKRNEYLYTPEVAYQNFHQPRQHGETLSLLKNTKSRPGGSSDLPTSASQSAGITGMRHCTRLQLYL